MSEAARIALQAFDPTLPLEQASTLPALCYTDPSIHEIERRAVFANSWVMAGRLDQLQEAGAFVTETLAGEPILLVRGEDQVLRAFYNVCRHRAARVVTEAAGRASKLRCRYHGWTYDLAGRLRGVPEFEGVTNFRREDNGLAPLHVAVWGPLVFVCGSSNPAPLHDYLAPLPARTEGLAIEALRFYERKEYELNCNWKVFVDNYLDGGYHVNTIHPGLSSVLNYAEYRTENAGNTSAQISPMRAPTGEADPAVADVRKGNTAYYWWVFPNLMINLYQGVMDTNLVLPLGPDRCRVIFDFYFDQLEGEAAARFNAESVAVGHHIQMEDVEICEDVQQGLRSRAFATGRFSVRRESGVYHFHKLLAQELARAVSSDSL